MIYYCILRSRRYAMSDVLEGTEPSNRQIGAAENFRLDRLTYEELAKVLRVKPCTVRAWQRRGLPAIPCGRLKFYNWAAVEAWLRERDHAKRLVKQQRQAAA